MSANDNVEQRIYDEIIALSAPAGLVLDLPTPSLIRKRRRSQRIRQTGTVSLLVAAVAVGIPVSANLLDGGPSTILPTSDRAVSAQVGVTDKVTQDVEETSVPPFSQKLCGSGVTTSPSVLYLDGGGFATPDAAIRSIAGLRPNRDLIVRDRPSDVEVVIDSSNGVVSTGTFNVIKQLDGWLVESFTLCTWEVE